MTQQVLDRARKELEVIRLVADGVDTKNAIHEATGMPKKTTGDILRDLVDAGVLHAIGSHPSPYRYRVI